MGENTAERPVVVVVVEQLLGPHGQHVAAPRLLPLLVVVVGESTLLAVAGEPTQLDERGRPGRLVAATEPALIDSVDKFRTD